MLDALYCLGQSGRERVALFGVNPAAAVDLAKQAGYRLAMRTIYPGAASRVYPSDGDIADAARRFAKESDADAAICVNDFAALCLQNATDGGLAVIGFGNTLLGAVARVPLTTITLDYGEVGRQAVSIWQHLRRFPGARAVSCAIACRIVPRASTPGLAQARADGLSLPSDDWMPVENPFFEDPWIREASRVDTLLCAMTVEDVQILRGMAQGLSYEALAERAYLSIGTVKYRLKRLLGVAGFADRDEMAAAIARWTNEDGLARLDGCLGPKPGSPAD